MAQPHLTNAGLVDDEVAEARRLDEALKRFWGDFVRKPSWQKTPGRQYVNALLDETPYWTTSDGDFEGAAAFTPNVFLAGLADDNVVEIPALFVVLAGASDVIAASAAAHARCADLGLPLPHYELASPAALTLIWRIQPFHRPKMKKPTLVDGAHGVADQLVAWMNGKLWWRLAMAKLDLAFAELGATVSPMTRLLPMPHPAPVSKYLDNGAYLLDAAPDLPTLRVADISKPLNYLDLDAWKRVRPHDLRAPKFLLGKKAWIGSQRFLEAKEPKREGERHAAALTQTCCYRWAGYEPDAILAELRAWADGNVDTRGFPHERSTSDELKDIVAWAVKKLVPGGPTERDAPIRGHYTRREAAIACVLAFLEEHAAGGEWIGTLADLAAAATMHSAQALAANQVNAPRATAVTRDSLKKLLPSLRAEHGVVTVVERSGETWTTRWKLLRAPAQAQPKPPPAPREFEATDSLIQAVDAGIASPLGQSRMSIGPLVLAPDLGGSSKSDLSRFQNQDGGSGGRPLPPGEGSSATTSRSIDDARVHAFSEGFQFLAGELSSSRSDQRGDDDALSGGLAVPSDARVGDDAQPGGLSVRSNARAGDAQLGGLAARSEDHAAVEHRNPIRRAASLDTPLPEELEARVRGLCALGLSLTLLQPNSKEPVRERWTQAQHQRTSAERLLLALRAQPDANLAIVCGEISNIVVVDLDSEDAVRWADDELTPTPVKTKTARGEHWFYLWPGPVTNRRRLRGVDADVKADGGYVVAPGSLHPTGIRYQALGTWTRQSFEALPIFDRAWLDGITDDELAGFEGIRAIKEATRAGDNKQLRDIIDRIKR